MQTVDMSIVLANGERIVRDRDRWQAKPHRWRQHREKLEGVCALCWLTPDASIHEGPRPTQEEVHRAYERAVESYWAQWGGGAPSASTSSSSMMVVYIILAFIALMTVVLFYLIGLIEM